jgi:hypothetical protein
MALALAALLACLGAAAGQLTLATPPSGPIYPNTRLLPRPTLTLDTNVIGVQVVASAIGPGALVGTLSVATFNNSVAQAWKVVALFSDLSFTAPGTYTLRFNASSLGLTVSTTVYVMSTLALPKLVATCR